MTTNLFMDASRCGNPVALYVDLSEAYKSKPRLPTGFGKHFHSNIFSTLVQTMHCSNDTTHDPQSYPNVRYSSKKHPRTTQNKLFVILSFAGDTYLTYLPRMYMYVPHDSDPDPRF